MAWDANCAGNWIVFAPGYATSARRHAAPRPIRCCKRWNISGGPFRAAFVQPQIFNGIFSILFWDKVLADGHQGLLIFAQLRPSRFSSPPFRAGDNTTTPSPPAGGLG